MGEQQHDTAMRIRKREFRANVTETLVLQMASPLDVAHVSI